MLEHLIGQQTKMKLKQWQNIFCMIVSENSIVQHEIQIKNGIIKQVNLNVKFVVSGMEFFLTKMTNTIAYDYCFDKLSW